MDILISNCTVVPVTGGSGEYFAGAVGIRGRRIEMVSCNADGEQHRQRIERFVAGCGNGLRFIDGEGMAVMPGLVNIHNHAAMSLMRGYADDIPLFRWLNEYIWPFEAGLTPGAVHMGTQLSIAEMLLGGTTTFVDMYWMQTAVAKAVGEGGIRAMLSPTFVDANFGTFERDLEAVAGIGRDAYDGRVGVMIAPHSPYSCSEEHLREVVELSRRYDVALNIHVAETRDEIEVIYNKYGKTPVEFLRDVGFFTRPALAVHSVHVSEGDMHILRENNVSVAHNPQSNMKLGSGIAPVARMMELGINVGLGTDGPCSNNDLDMWEEMRSASFLQKVATGEPTVLPAYEVLRMATVNGAKAIGLDKEIGTIEEGKLADIILIDTRKPHLSPCHDLIANLVYCAKSADVSMVVVNGEIVVENGRCLTLDVAALRKAAQEYIQSRK